MVKPRFLKSSAFWFDIVLLTILWLIVVFIPTEYKIVRGISVSDLLKLVALISSLEALGFFCYYFLGNRAGALIQGFLGGFVSSTMTYLKITRSTRKHNSRSITSALLLATIAMLIECIFIIITIHPGAFSLLTPILIQLGCLVLAIWIIKPPIQSEQSTSASKIQLDEPIIWKKVIYFSLFIMVLIFSMRFISNIFKMPYLLTSFFVSLFEAHGVLAAAMTEHQNITDYAEARNIIMAILVGNVISKTFFIVKARDRSIIKPVLLALYLSLLASFSVYLFS